MIILAKAPKRRGAAKKPKCQARVAASKKTWNAKNREKVRAHQAVYAASIRGLIIRQPCVVCGCNRSQAHHDDYSRPLDVTWLCQLHHKALHAALKNGGNTVSFLEASQ